MYIGRGPVKGGSDRGARRAQQERSGRYLWALLQKGVHQLSKVSSKKKRKVYTYSQKKGVHQKQKGAHQLSKVSSKKKKGILKKKSVHQKERCTPTLKSQLYSDLTQYVS
jgi:hypothetical protein